jgi:hypothetical protein
VGEDKQDVLMIGSFDDTGLNIFSSSFGTSELLFSLLCSFCFLLNVACLKIVFFFFFFFEGGGGGRDNYIFCIRQNKILSHFENASEMDHNGKSNQFHLRTFVTIHP